jgi:hypothetical protein
MCDVCDWRIVMCEACGSEGRIYEPMWTYERDCGPHLDDVDVGPCPYCDGTGGEIIATQPIEFEDLATLGGDDQ